MSKADDSASGAVASQRGSANAGSVEVGRDIIGSVVVTGHGNQVTVTI
jgi:hypothetical protein